MCVCVCIYTHTLQNIGIKQYILSLYIYKVIIVISQIFPTKYLPLSTGAIKFFWAIFSLQNQFVVITE